MALTRIAILLLLCPLAVADDRRAEVNYMLHCQGCHLPNAEGFDGRVPPMKDFVGYFLHSEEGRRFVVRDPLVDRNLQGARCRIAHIAATSSSAKQVR